MSKPLIMKGLFDLKTNPRKGTAVLVDAHQVEVAEANGTNPTTSIDLGNISKCNPGLL